MEITFGGSVSVDGRVVALHPEHNLALVAYDPAQLGETPVESAELREEPLAPGDDVWLVTLTQRQQLLARAVARSSASTRRASRCRACRASARRTST